MNRRACGVRGERERERERRCREGSHSHFAPPSCCGVGRCRKDLPPPSCCGVGEVQKGPECSPSLSHKLPPPPSVTLRVRETEQRAKVHGARMSRRRPENVHSGPARTQWRVEDIRTSADTATNIGEHMPRGAGRRVIKRATCHCMMHRCVREQPNTILLDGRPRRTGTSNLANREKNGSDRAFFRVDPGCGLVGFTHHGLKPGWPGGPRPGVTLSERLKKPGLAWDDPTGSG